MQRDGVWRTSTRSGGEGNCVEVAGHPATVGVRDSKDRRGPVLTFGAEAWRVFIETVTTDHR